MMNLWSCIMIQLSRRNRWRSDTLITTIKNSHVGKILNGHLVLEYYKISTNKLQETTDIGKYYIVNVQIKGYINEKQQGKMPKERDYWMKMHLWTHLLMQSLQFSHKNSSPELALNDFPFLFKIELICVGTTEAVISETLTISRTKI